MRAFSLLLRNKYFRFKAKRVIQIGKETVQVGMGQSPQMQPTQDSKSVDVAKVPWQVMNLEELSQLGSTTLSAISYQLNKTKQSFAVSPHSSEGEPSVHKLNPHLQQLYRKLVELEPQPQQKLGSLAQLYDLNLIDNPDILQLIQTAYSKLATPQGQLNVLEPSLIKYLVGVNSDLARAGLSLKNHNTTVEKVRPINIEYEFWVGVNRNRSRNHTADYYVSYQKQLDNPNQSLLMQQPANRKIKLQYIIIKRRPEKYFMGYIVKALMEVTVGGGRHHVKIEFEGPQSTSIHARPLIDPNYRVIDIDGVMNGNPTIRPVFRFG